MSAGTFEALCRNPVFYLQNMDGFARVKGKIQDAVLTITAEDPACTDTVSWMVVGERKDPYVIQAGHTTDDGCLITEIAVEPTADPVVTDTATAASAGAVVTDPVADPATDSAAADPSAATADATPSN
jgi:hypothetical protein